MRIATNLLSLDPAEGEVLCIGYNLYSSLACQFFQHNVAPNMYLFRLNVSTLICLFFFFFFACNFQGSTIGSGSGWIDSGSGWIELVLIEAKDLVAADLRGTSDPYVRAQYGNLKKRTKV